MRSSAGTFIRVGIDILNLWDWSELEDENVGNLLSHIVELSGTSIGDDVTDIGVDFADVHEGVGESFLEESDWILEDGSPDLDSLDVWLHTLAILKININGGDNFSDLRDTLDNVHDVLLFEVFNGGVELNFNTFGIGEAWLDLIEIVISNESIEESSNELDNLVVVETGNGGGGENFGERHLCFFN